MYFLLLYKRTCIERIYFVLEYVSHCKVIVFMQVANQAIEISRREKEEVAARLSQVEGMLADGKLSMQKLENDNSRLRRALEQSMTTLNRMSLDSDNSVDRCGVFFGYSAYLMILMYTYTHAQLDFVVMH